MENKKYLVTATPHIRSKDSIESVMKDVVFALLPTGIMGIYYFGVNALMVILAAVVSCMLFEYYFQRFSKKPITVTDYSAVITGLLLAYNLPATIPIWAVVVGSFVAIIVIKQLFGGLGQNFLNPALGARAFLLAAYPVEMTTWISPIKNPLGFAADAVSTATPLSILKSGEFIPLKADYINALIGNVGGCIGETSVIALLIGAIYLLVKKVISWRIPVLYLGTVFILSYIIGRNGVLNDNAFYELLTGGLILGAFFMATDYSSSPVTPNGQIIMGVGCGVLTVVIRIFGSYAEGVSYSILIMNLVVPIIDKYIRPRVFGTTKKKAVQ